MFHFDKYDIMKDSFLSCKHRIPNILNHSSIFFTFLVSYKRDMVEFSAFFISIFGILPMDNNFTVLCYLNSFMNAFLTLICFWLIPCQDCLNQCK